MAIVKYFVSYNYLENNQLFFGNAILNIRDGITDSSIKNIQKMIEEKYGLTDPIIVNYEELNTKGGEVLDMDMVEKLTTIKDSVLAMKLLEKDFSEEQIKQIQKGFIMDLTVEQVMIYADPELNPEQMAQIIIAFAYYKLDIEKVRRYIKFSAEQMNQIYFALDGKLTIEQVDEFAKPENTPADMAAARMRLGVYL